jgi:hypothetical protein
MGNGCDGKSDGGSSSTPGRPFLLGFSDAPFARSDVAVLDAYDVIERDGDLALMHFDEGVPWQEAAAGAPWAVEFRDQIDLKAGFIPRGHVIYVAVNPLNFERDGLAPHRGASGNEPLVAPWNTASFDDAMVIDAFVEYCERMIADFSPSYFAYAIEANMLREKEPGQWAPFIRLARAVYTALKQNHPGLPIFVTLQADFFHADRADQSSAVAELLPYTDIIAVSTYPFAEAGQADPAALRGDHFEAMAALSPAKRVAIAETGWPAEDVAVPAPRFVPASEQAQRAYVERVLGEADELSAVFVVWFFSRDYDEFWNEELRFRPEAPTLRLWKDTGLYSGEGIPRSALVPWRERLSRPRR